MVLYQVKKADIQNKDFDGFNQHWAFSIQKILELLSICFWSAAFLAQLGLAALYIVRKVLNSTA